MSKVCDHTSVGMLVWNGDKLLLIERAKFPFGFAVPAGHVDDDISFGDETNNHEAAYQKTARRELKEEVGLDAVGLELITEGRKENPCRREGGSWHYWKFYKANVSGDIASKVVRSLDETKNVGWYTKTQIQELAKTNKLEPVMYQWFKDLKII